ncbi:MAG: ribonuclease activity regulator RraA [Actinobacteria bacterium]|nr:ribonuclease activity regulator RraA [Actinomycetota bacterium]
MARLHPDLEDALRQVSTATLSTQLLRHGYKNTFLTGLEPLRPDLRMVGTAFTLRYVPTRADVDNGSTFDNATNPQRVAIETIGPGDVLVIDARSDLRAGSLGNILATRAQQRGAAGIVTDGALRDSPAFRELDLPTYAGGAHAGLSSTIHHPVEYNVPIGCAGVLVLPGDVVVGDAEGVVVFPSSIVDEVATASCEQEKQEKFILGEIQSGASIHGVYPPNEELLVKYRRHQLRQV